MAFSPDFSSQKVQQQIADELAKQGPYHDPELNFGEENAKMYKDISDRIPFIVSDIKQEFFGRYMAKMYRCMADCEENLSLISRDDIRNCLNDCSNTLLTPKRAIVETEVNRLTNMMNRELDTCMDRSMLTMHHESYKPEHKSELEGEYQRCNKIALNAFNDIVKTHLSEKLKEKLRAAERK